jgi:hypothetical protein
VGGLLAATCERFEHLARLRVPPGALLGEDRLPVGDHVELAVRALDGVDVVPVLSKLGRETRGPFVVAASDGAVEDADARHVRTLV